MNEPKVYELNDPELYALLATEPPHVDIRALCNGVAAVVRLYQPRLINDGGHYTIAGNVMVRDHRYSVHISNE